MAMARAFFRENASMDKEGGQADSTQEQYEKWVVFLHRKS
jgi:hypothetical protein